MSFELRQRIERVAGRVRSFRMWTMLAVCWLVWTCVGAALFELGPMFGWSRPSLVPWIAALAAFSAVIAAYAAKRSARDPVAIARRVEGRYPELAALLLTAVEQKPARRGEALGFLQHAVVREAVQHGRSRDWSEAVSDWKIWLAQLAHIVALVLLVAVCAGFGRLGAQAGSSGGPLHGQSGSRPFEVEIEPGDTELERGSPLLIVARFLGEVPEDATLIVSGASAQDAEQSTTAAHEMTRPLDDPKFVCRVPSVERDLSYYIESGGWRSREFQVTVFDYPELVRADVDLEFPEYTGLGQRRVEDVRQITAVEGTRLTLRCRINKPVSKATLVSDDGDELSLTPQADSPNLYLATWKPPKSHRFKLHLTDDEGRQNRLPPEFVVNITPNRPPTIVVERPGRDTEVSPLEELVLEAAITDDYGLLRGGVSYSMGGGEPRELVLFDADSPPEKQRSVAHLIDFESLAAQPDQLLAYFVWTEDSGVDGKPRRAMSDMFFAEVRPFEQVFRQGQQPAGGEQQQQGGSPNSQAAMELAELQKEIVNATWRLIRRETGEKPTAEFSADSKTIAQSQQSAIDRASELTPRIEDEEAAAHLKRAIEAMQTALEHLTAAQRDAATEPLQPALVAEQLAYQSLLKLRAREFQVVQGNRQQGGGGGGGNRMQQQLDQLELRAEENRYETQRQARATEATQADRDNRDILNRLSELARRQDDLNERLKELQSALEQARTPEEREEIRRELKRLRDQQRDILRDSDEMIGRIEQSSNSGQMERARQQATESRSHLQQASDALEREELSRALTEGTRAGRQLNDLRDDFRKQAANRFSQELTEYRRDVRRLDENQQRLADELERSSREPGPGLRDTGRRAEVEEGLGQQRRDLVDLMERMQQTVQEAEQPEPLLAEQLYDTIRRAHQQKIEDALEVSQRLTELGIEHEAGQAMRTAGRGLGDLRRDVERAAESVLGDETEALRRAKDEVEQLASELQREIDEAQPDDSTQRDEEGQLAAGSGTAEEQSERQPSGGQISDGRTLRGVRDSASRTNLSAGDLERLLGGGPGGPITGEAFRDWVDRMRDVEQMLEDPELRDEAARIRGRAQEARLEYKRHAKLPNWNTLEQMVAEPLNELGQRLAEEIYRRTSPDMLVPIDRDPVPFEFTEQVRRYYEQLGAGE